MLIANRAIGPEQPVFLVAEVGVTSNGDIHRALDLIDAIAEAKCDAAKFIVTDPDKIMSRKDVEFTYDQYHPGELYVNHGREYLTRETRPIYDLLKSTTFTFGEWSLIQQACEERGIIFFATADHLEAVDMLEELKVPAYKTSAWDIAWRPLFHRMRATGKPILVDVGTATREEVNWAFNAPGAFDQQHLFVHSPHPRSVGDWMGDWNLSRLTRRFANRFGFSSPGRESWCDFVALGGGACLIEKRITLRRDDPVGHHHAVSLEPHEFAGWVQDMRRADATLHEDPFAASDMAWAERKKWDRDERGLRP